eukprot:gene4879-2362_t
MYQLKCAKGFFSKPLVAVAVGILMPLALAGTVVGIYFLNLGNSWLSENANGRSDLGNCKNTGKECIFWVRSVTKRSQTTKSKTRTTRTSCWFIGPKNPSTFQPPTQVDPVAKNCTLRVNQICTYTNDTDCENALLVLPSRDASSDTPCFAWDTRDYCWSEAYQKTQVADAESKQLIGLIFLPIGLVLLIGSSVLCYGHIKFVFCEAPVPEDAPDTADGADTTHPDTHTYIHPYIAMDEIAMDEKPVTNTFLLVLTAEGETMKAVMKAEIIGITQREQNIVVEASNPSREETMKVYLTFTSDLDIRNFLHHVPKGVSSKGDPDVGSDDEL